jgi:uncharacterized protein YoxC
MINVNHEEIEAIIQALEEEMGAIQARIDELYQLQWQNRDDIATTVNNAIDTLFDLHCDFTDAIAEVKDAIEDCED